MPLMMMTGSRRSNTAFAMTGNCFMLVVSVMGLGSHLTELESTLSFCGSVATRAPSRYLHASYTSAHGLQGGMQLYGIVDGDAGARTGRYLQCVCRGVLNRCPP